MHSTTRRQHTTSVPNNHNIIMTDNGDHEMEPLHISAGAGAGSTSVGGQQQSTTTIASGGGGGGGSAGSVPVGHWRDDMWSIFRHGYCHCSVLNSCCCIPIAIGQVMTRLQLNWTGQPVATSTLSAKHAVVAATFKKMLYLVCSFWLVRVLLLIIIAILDPNTDSDTWIDPPSSYYFFCMIDDMLALLYFCFSVVVLRNTRAYIRSKYAIPEADQCPTGCEDTCCSVFCSCCVVAQLLRHTAEYETTPARCCTSTGLPPNAPSIV